MIFEVLHSKLQKPFSIYQTSLILLYYQHLLITAGIFIYHVLKFSTSSVTSVNLSRLSHGMILALDIFEFIISYNWKGILLTSC